MAKAICRYSGIEFRIEHFPFSFTKGQCIHPSFTLTSKELLGMAGQWSSRKLTETDTKLYFLSLLHSTSLVEFRSYAKPKISVCEQHMESLIREVAWVDSLTEATLQRLPRFVINADTSDLSTVEGWLDAWKQSRADLAEGYHTYNLEQKQIRREAALERLIKTPSRTVESYSKALAEWAAFACEFPNGEVPAPSGSGTITLRSYWIDLIQKCGNTDFQIWKVDRKDLEELLEYLEENLNHGSIYASSVMKLLRNALDRHNNLLGMGSPKFTILDEQSGVEQQNIQAAIAAAPEIEPILEDYPNKVAFLRAKARWILAEKHRQAQPEHNVSGIGEL